MSSHVSGFTEHRLAVPNMVHEPSRHPHTRSEYTSEPPTPIDFDLIPFLDLPRWAAGRGYWKSGAAHTLDIYKSTNHWNHRNAVFHFPCLPSLLPCGSHWSHKGQQAPLRSVFLPLFLWHLPSPQPLFFINPLWFSFSYSLRLGFSSFISPSCLSPSWAAAQSGLTKSLAAKPAPLLLTCLSKLHTVFFAQSISDWALVVCIWKYEPKWLIPSNDGWRAAVVSSSSL